MELSQVLFPLRAPLAAVEAELIALSSRLAALDGSHPAPLGILGEISKHPFAVPGKRLRPALVLLSRRAASRRGASGPPSGCPPGSDGDGPAIRLAAAVEVLHAASLVHDDIIDRATERRHQVSLNRRFGDRVAVLAGDILYTEFFDLVTRLPVEPALASRLLSIFLGTTRKMCVGEIFAQEAEAAGRRLGLEEYLELCEFKTASLFASSCEGGALIGGAGEAEALAFRDFGLLFGLSFQMLDDLSDRDHRLDPTIDLLGLTGGFVERAKEAARSLGLEEVAEGMDSLVENMMAQSIEP